MLCFIGAQYIMSNHLIKKVLSTWSWSRRGWGCPAYPLSTRTPDSLGYCWTCHSDNAYIMPCNISPPPHTHSHSQINIFPKFSPSPFLVFSVHYLTILQCQAKILLFCRFDKKPNLVLACLLLKSPYDCHSKVTLIHVMSLLCKHVVFDTLLPPTLVSNKLLRQILYCYSSSVDTS